MLSCFSRIVCLLQSLIAADQQTALYLLEFHKTVGETELFIRLQRHMNKVGVKWLTISAVHLGSDHPHVNTKSEQDLSRFCLECFLNPGLRIFLEENEEPFRLRAQTCVCMCVRQQQLDHYLAARIPCNCQIKFIFLNTIQLFEYWAYYLNVYNIMWLFTATRHHYAPELSTKRVHQVQVDRIQRPICFLEERDLD